MLGEIVQGLKIFLLKIFLFKDDSYIFKLSKIFVLASIASLYDFVISIVFLNNIMRQSGEREEGNSFYIDGRSGTLAKTFETKE